MNTGYPAAKERTPRERCPRGFRRLEVIATSRGNHSRKFLEFANDGCMSPSFICRHHALNPVAVNREALERLNNADAAA